MSHCQMTFKNSGNHAFQVDFLQYHHTNMSQLKALYKDEWESLVGNCDEFYIWVETKRNP